MKYEDLEPKNFGGCNYRSWLAQKYSGMIDCQSPIEALLGGAMETMIFDYQHSLSDRTVYFSVGIKPRFILQLQGRPYGKCSFTENAKKVRHTNCC